MIGYKLQRKKSLQVNRPLRTVFSGRCQSSGRESKVASLHKYKKRSTSLPALFHSAVGVGLTADVQRSSAN